ncbi:MAG: hypothetical protein EHM48_10430, partial [Planctomycetaceae bacterium]
DFGITKDGAGALTLSNANTFTGPVNLKAGTLNLGNAAALGSTNATLTIDGGTLDNTSAGTLTLSGSKAIIVNGDFAFTGTQSLNLGTGAVTFNATPKITVNANTLTVGGAITGGAYGITKDGAGTLLLSVANTMTGPVTIKAGTLSVGNAGSLGTPSSIVFDGGVLNNTTGGSIALAPSSIAINGSFGISGVEGFNLGTAPVTLTATPDINVTIGTSTTRSLTLGGVISGDGFGITKSGLSTLNLTGANTFTGPVTVNAGTLNLGNATALGGSTSLTLNGGTINASTAAITLPNGSTVAINGNFAFTGNKAIDFGTTSSVTIVNTPTISVANTLTIGGVITGGTSGLTKAGTGTLVLKGSNDFSGDVSVTGGVIDVYNDNALGTSTKLILAGGAINNYSGAERTLANNPEITVSGLLSSSLSKKLNMGTGAVTLAGNTTFKAYGSAGVVYGGPVAGAGYDMTFNYSGMMQFDGNMSNVNAINLTSTNGGKVILNGNNSNIGTITVSGGSL